MDGVPVEMAMANPETFGQMLQHHRGGRTYAEMARDFAEWCESQGALPPRREESMYQWCNGIRVPSDHWRLLLFQWLDWSPGTIAMAAQLIGQQATKKIAG